MTSNKVTLTINGNRLEIAIFVQQFIKQVVIGMLSALKGVGEIHSVHLVCRDDQVEISINGTAVPSNEFVNEFVGNTVRGMVSSLKGVEQIEHLEISIT